ncbi:MAG: hypothetical protein ACXWPM_12015, partial [Bdellovibrionota bacterium]
VAPFKAMAMSRKFQENPPLSALSVFGARDQEELLYTGFFEKLGVQEAAALSQPKAGWNGYRGRVTDYLKSLGAEWAWRETDFYLCGNGAMVTDVRKILLSFGVPEKSIHQEVYFSAGRVQKDITARRAA